MATTLVINGSADFAENALATVSFGGDIPCTALALNKSTAQIAYGGTDTLTATPTPADTTDTVTWASSSESVATVNNGVVTAVGLGTATITATCGEISATCSVSVSAIMSGENVPGLNLSGATSYSGSIGYPYVGSSARYGIMVSDEGTYKIGNPVDSNNYYPYIMPNGTGKLKITLTSLYIEVSRIQFLSTTVPCQTSGYTDCAQLIDDIRTITLTDGVYETVIPQYEGYPTIDGIAILLRGKSSSYVFSNSDFNDITVEFLPN